MIFEPRLNTRRVERVLTRAQSPDLFAVGEHRQTHGALVADLLGMSIFLEFHAGIRRGGGRGASLGHVRRCDIHRDVIVGETGTAGGRGSAAARRTWEKSVY